MDRLLGVLAIVSFIGFAYLYLQLAYVAWLDCPGAIRMELIPKCEGKEQ